MPSSSWYDNEINVDAKRVTGGHRVAFETRIGTWVGLLAVFCGMLSFAACSPGEQQTFVRVASGPAGGYWYPLGAKQAEIFQREIPDVAASSGPGGGVGNIRDVSNGEAEVGYTYAHDAHSAFAGDAPFTQAHTDLMHLASLYPAAYQVAVPASSDIYSYRDLGDRNLSPGKLTDSGYTVFETVMGRYGLAPDVIRANGGTIHHVSYTDSVALMKDGHIDAAFAITGFPQAFFLDLEFRPGIRFLSMEEAILDEIIEENPGYISVSITDEHYSSVDTPVTTLGAVTTLVVNRNMSDDLVYAMTSALWDAHAELVAVADAWEQVSLETAVLGAAIPVHPGALRYYREHGVTVPAD